MTTLILKLLIFTTIAAIAPQILPGVKVKGVGTAVSVALVFGLLNLVIGWFLSFAVGVVSLPLTCLTLGIFRFLIPTIVNAILLKITDAALDDFNLTGWWPAFLMGFAFGLGSLAANALTH